MHRLILTSLLLSVVTLPAAITVTGSKAAAVTVHPAATEAALDAMRRGGNAVDAAVAAGLMLGVVDGHNSGVGGGCFMLIRAPDGTVTAFDGRETAPAAATHDMYMKAGRAEPAMSQTGALAAGVPGSLAVYEAVTGKFGRRPLAEALRRAAEVAANGFTITGSYAGRLKSAAAELAKFPESRAIFLTPDGAPLAEGVLLKQHDLSVSYRAMAEKGVAWFYDGPFAEATGKWMTSNGGILTAQDFRDYRPVVREPLRTVFRKHAIIGFPPPSSGGVHVAEILNILAARQAPVTLQGADDIHFTVESMKLAFADRAHWLGDPDFVSVPRGLVSPDYARTLAAKINPLKVTPVTQHSTPDRATDDVFGKHTTHFSTADAEGWWVACTATVNTTFGSKVVIPGTGIVLNNQMDDFSIQPGVRNAFGLIGAEANAVAPRKRPLSSMAPTIVLRDGQPFLSLGAAGGPTIISQVTLSIVRVVDGGLALDDALAAPRFHHQWSPDELRIETAAGKEVIADLRGRGHKPGTVSVMGACNGIMRLPDGRFLAAGDPRVPGSAGAF